MARPSDTRDKLIETMLTLMWRDGYAGVSVDKVCKAAEVNKGSFYHFFPSKEDLALAALQAGWTAADEGLYRTAFDPLLHPLERINRLMDLITDSHRNMLATGQWQAEQGCPFGNIGAEAGVDDERIKGRVREIYEAEAAYFRAALEDALILGCISPCNPHEMAMNLVALQTGLFQHAKVYGNADWLTRFIPAAGGLLGVPVEDGKFVIPKGVGTR